MKPKKVLVFQNCFKYPFMVHPVKFFGFCLLFVVPAAVPAVREKVEGNKVEVSWVAVPRGQRGGCITNYTIYLENSNGVRQSCKNRLSELLLSSYNTSSTGMILCSVACTLHASL